ncbi:ABC transporter ATP-binding protein [Ornithinibacillus halotolerans]|uniref:ABC transporter ATP-binding protein n=1 Tax=Ornithinibacillus halotolerans TaxID=1274357 RepID=A0A916S9B5_9BACI|nr:ABC transporter ATP-binding protein [Ornithinibacillus halotolerans]GGA89820.1 ABC transporter ATP-binding protein [Ornithinibacillus halotolerans]
MSILSISNLSKSYKKQKVLNRISLTIDTPGIWALVGPNGVGKTTFLNVLTNLIPADSGDVELLGNSNKSFQVFKEIAYLQDNTILFDYLTGYDHLKYLCDIHKLSKKRVPEVAGYVGMENYLKKTVGSYSLGMKQHLLLAMAMVNKPKLIFLDEPLNGLDPTSAILIRKILLELAEQGTTIILSSHNLAEIDRVTKRILFLKNGKLIEVDMNDHELVNYHLVLSEPSKAITILNEKGFQVEELDNGIKVRLQNQSLNNLIDSIKEHAIEIVDIQKVISGSEKLYESLYEV